jgi:tRNA threonylcarbamoyladenosine biosynthesis protein TsaB
VDDRREIAGTVILLALESATPQAAVALATEAGVLATASASGRRHGETLAPAIEFVCRRAGIRLNEVNALAVDIGPGLFTGLRVGVGMAKALAFALGIPVAPVTSLDVIAQTLASSGAAHGAVVVPVVDARRGEVFWARYRVDADRAVALDQPHRSSPEAVRGVMLPEPSPVLFAGDGAQRYAALLSSGGFAGEGWAIAGRVHAFPSVGVLAELGMGKVIAEAVEDASRIAPMYLREADTNINWERRLPPTHAVST